MRGFILSYLLLGIIPLTTSAQHAFDDLPIDDPSKRSMLAPGEDPAKKIRDNMFIVATIDHPRCYPGQQVQLSYRLYTALQSTSTVSARPQLNGFTVKERKPDETPLPEKIIRGRHYQGFTVWRALLTPLQPGDYTLEGLTVSNEVSFTGAGGKPVRYSGAVTAGKTTIHVIPLPRAGRPPDFILPGLVGKWRIHSRLSAPYFDSGEYDTLFVEITGAGNFENITLPAIRWPAGFHPSESIQRWVVNDSTTPQSGKTIIAVPFAAASPGKYILPSMNLAYFDPAAGKYYTERSERLNVLVLRAAALASVPQRTVAPAQTIVSPRVTQPVIPRLVFPVLFFAVLILLVIQRSNRHRPASRDPLHPNS